MSPELRTDERSKLSLGDGASFSISRAREWHIGGFRSPDLPIVAALLRRADSASAKCALLHSATVDFHGRAVLATGPSGCGKSTFATLMSDCAVLSDEFNLIELANGRFYAAGTPIRSKCPRPPNNLRRKLGAIIFPVKSLDSCVQRVSPAVAAARLSAQVVVLGELGSKPSLGFLARLVESVPAYYFHFRKDSSARKLLDELELS